MNILLVTALWFNMQLNANGVGVNQVILPAGTQGEVNSFVVSNNGNSGTSAPVFPGGEQALKNYFDQAIQYPRIAREQGIEGRVTISFVIDENGKPSDIEVVQGIGGGCDEEVVRVISEMPLWLPAVQENNKVKSKHIFSFNFRL